MSSTPRRVAKSTVILLLLAAAGLIAAGYVLLHERLPNPFQSTYPVTVELTAADGVVPGLGQPVEVAGVNVGSITRARVDGGDALITLDINASQLPHVYTNATATLSPITPLDDMELLLDPGGPPAAAAPSGTTIPAARATSPVPLSDLLSALDVDTRSWLSTVISSLGQGTNGQARNLRKLLVMLAPAAQQLHTIAATVAARDRALARLVHNIALVTHAATQDRQLASVVVAGDQTLRTIADENTPLNRSLALLPQALSDTQSTLTNAANFSRVLTPTLNALTPAIDRLPATFSALEPFARHVTSTLGHDVTPFVRAAQPVAAALGPATRSLTQLTPNLTSTAEVLQYATNELAYNAGGQQQGMLFWLDWFAHNALSTFGSEADAHGALGRALILASCSQLSPDALGPLFKLIIGVANVCPN
jgi:phospholipid/cholesterol/gamma-HCH transport system substrate-binding protein